MTPKTTRLLFWRGPLPEPGEFLATKRPTFYLVLQVRRNMRPDRKSVARLELARLDADDTLPAGAVVHDFAWAERRKRR